MCHRVKLKSMADGSREPVQLGIEPETVVQVRRALAEMVRGNPIGEAAVAGFSDWEAIEAFERMWAVAIGRDEVADHPDPVREQRTHR
jgi:hypothetical protein